MSSSVGRRHPSALIVDDQPLARAALSRSFRDLGWETVDASGVGEALELCRALPSLSLAVIENLMRGAAGLQVIPALRAVAPGIVCVLISERLTVDVCQEAQRAGADSVLAKPITAPEIVASLGPPESLDAISYRHLNRLIVLAHGNRVLAAKHAGTSRRGIDYKLEKLKSVLP